MIFSSTFVNKANVVSPTLSNLQIHSQHRHRGLFSIQNSKKQMNKQAIFGGRNQAKGRVQDLM